MEREWGEEIVECTITNFEQTWKTKSKSTIDQSINQLANWIVIELCPFLLRLSLFHLYLGH